MQICISPWPDSVEGWSPTSLRASSVLVTVLLVALALSPALLAGPARAQDETFAPSTVEADPGTLSGAAAELVASDDVKVTISEEDYPASPVTIASMYMPTGTGAGEFDFRFGCAIGVGLSWDCVDEIPVNDGNTSYILSAATSDFANFGYSAWVGPVDMTIAGVSTFMWFRKNQPAAAGFSLQLMDSTGSCVAGVPLETLAFANFTTALATTACDGVTAWTVALIDSTTTAIAKSGISGPGTVTSVARVVEYSDRDYQVVAYANFTQLSGSGWDYRLEWEGASSLSGETLALQVDRGGTWTTIASPFLSSPPDGTGSYTIAAEESDAGAVRFRIVDSSTSDETGESFALDVLRVVATRHSGPGNDPSRALRVTCAFSWPYMAILCGADELLPAGSITTRAWSVNGVVVQATNASDGSGRTLQWTVAEGPWAPLPLNYSVVYTVWLGPAVRIDSRPTYAAWDGTWLWAVYLLVVIIVAIGLLLRVKPPRGPKAEPPKREAKA
jgi:hypothetical protein